MVEIIGHKGKEVSVRFLNTGYERDVLTANLKAGKCDDKSIKSQQLPNPKSVGEIVATNNSGDVEILHQIGKVCTVRFLNTGTVKKCNIDNLRAGKCSDPYAPTRYGIGYLGEYDKKNPYFKQAYQLWSNMTKRCYCEADHKGYFGKGVTVCDRWLCFANFLDDIPKLSGFSDWLLGQTEGAVKYNLDKDTLCEGNKVYCPEKCCFITDSLN
jgi:hypothetical protein